MNIDIKKVKIIVTVPIENTEEVRNAICDEGAGVIGNYTHCSIITKCIGTFKPTDEANPYIGEKNKLEFIEEDKLEVSKVKVETHTGCRCERCWNKFDESEMKDGLCPRCASAWEFYKDKVNE